VSQDLIVVVPAGLRDGRGVELDAALESRGARIQREQRRFRDDELELVELLVTDTSAPDHLRGRRVRPRWSEPATPDGQPDVPLELAYWELAEQ
jgi:hypothetical protein